MNTGKYGPEKTPYLDIYIYIYIYICIYTYIYIYTYIEREKEKERESNQMVFHLLIQTFKHLFDNHVVEEKLPF